MDCDIFIAEIIILLSIFTKISISFFLFILSMFIQFDMVIYYKNNFTYPLVVLF